MTLFVAQDILQTVFEDGKLVREYSFAEVRENAELPMVVEALNHIKVCFMAGLSAFFLFSLGIFITSEQRNSYG